MNDICLNAYGDTLPKAVYYQCTWTVRDIDRLKVMSEVNEYAGERLDAIYGALSVVPEEYRQALLESIAYYGSGYDDCAHENTWKRWKKQYIAELARRLKLI